MRGREPDAEPGAGAMLSASEGPPVLDVRDLHASYPVRRGMAGALRREPRRSVRAVDGVTFSLRKGEMLALVGESGCGKTTTAHAVLRLLDRTAVVTGTIALNGHDITDVPQRDLRPLRRRMQMVYQDPYESLDPRFRVSLLVEEPLTIHRVQARGADRQRLVYEALEKAELTPPELFLDRYPHELSGGQRQRVAVAASLVLGPELLVADEPVSMLDVSVRAGVLTLLDKLRRTNDMAALMITHDLSTAAHFADRIAVMYLGRIVEEGPSRAVVRDPQHPYTKALLSVVPQRDPRQRSKAEILRGEPPDPIDVPPGCRFHPRCPVATDVCRSTDPSLRPLSSAPDHRAACVLIA
jgi:oligopeptide/dipeptide ABC transporter ATP-binding protein